MVFPRRLVDSSVFFDGPLGPGRACVFELLTFSCYVTVRELRNEDDNFIYFPFLILLLALVQDKEGDNEQTRETANHHL